MGILRRAGARHSPARAGFLLPGPKRHLAQSRRRLLAAWQDPDLPLLLLETPPPGARVTHRAALDHREGKTLSLRLTTYVTESLATRLDITVLRAAAADHESLIKARAAKHVDVARLQAEAAERGVFADRTPRLPPDPQPWTQAPIVIDGASHPGRQQRLSSAEWLAYVTREDAVIELHAWAVEDLADARLKNVQPVTDQLSF